VSENVTYRGSTDGSVSDAYVLPGDPDLRFPLNVSVPDVPAEVVSELREVKGHRFDTGKGVASPGEPYAGYDEASAEDIVAHVESVGDPDLGATVASYEGDHKGRKTVLEAAKAVAKPEVSQGP
jgi:hypothetical protein